MKKSLIATCTIFSIVLQFAYSQDDKPYRNYSRMQKFNLVAGLDISKPFGSFSDTHSFGLGLNLGVNYRFNKLFSATGKIDFDYYFGKKYGSGYTGSETKYKGLSYLAVNPGIRFDIPATPIFINPEVGIGFSFYDSNSIFEWDSDIFIGYEFAAFRNHQMSMGLGYGCFMKDRSSSDFGFVRTTVDF